MRVAVLKWNTQHFMQSLIHPHYTERDFAILRSVFESRVMTRAHLAAIHFAGHARMTKKRLQKLAADGLVGSRPRRPAEPTLHFLTKRGYDLLDQAGHLAGYPRFGYDRFRKRIDVSPLTLAHELAVMDVKAAFYNAARARPDVCIKQFCTWPILFRFRVRSSDGAKPWVCPDGSIRLRGVAAGSIEQHFYLEVDRGTESLPVLGRKATAYLDHSQIIGTIKPLPFRVLWVFRSAARRDHAADYFLHHRPPILTQAWMTTMGELAVDPFGLIWLRPADYRDATKDSPFDPYRPTDTHNYRRQTERKEFVQRFINMHAIME